MSARADVRLFSLSKMRAKELEASLRALADVCPKSEIWANYARSRHGSRLSLMRPAETA